MRQARIERNTTETQIALNLELDGSGRYEIKTGCGFLTHMLELFARHGRFNITLNCVGDTQVDYHHTAEDIGIVLGRAFNEALKDRKGIYRYGSFMLPMDEALVLAAVDLGGRGSLAYQLAFQTEKIGEMDTEVLKEFFLAFVREAKLTVHLHQLAGENSHHIAEAAFKGLARALARAAAVNPAAPDEIPSTKGTVL